MLEKNKQTQSAVRKWYNFYLQKSIRYGNKGLYKLIGSAILCTEIKFSSGLVLEKPKKMRKNMVLGCAWREVFRA